MRESLGAALEIARAESKRHLRGRLLPIGAVLLAMLAYQPLAYTGPGSKGLVSIGIIPHDAPLIVGTLLGRVTLAGLFFIALIFGEAGHRDREGRYRALLLTTPATTGSIVAGRYFAGLTISLLLFAATLLGIGLALGGLDAKHLGPAGPVDAMLLPFLWMVVPTVAATGAIFLALGLIGGMAPVFVALAALVAAHPILAAAATVDGAWSAVPALLDPFGVAALTRASRFWSVVERGALPLPVDALFVAGRAMWIAAGAAALVVACRGLRKTVDASAPAPVMARWGTTLGRALQRLTPGLDSRSRSVPTSARSGWQMLARLELRRTVLHPATLALTALACIQVIRNLASATAADGTGSLPISAMLMSATANVDEFVLGLTVLFSGLLIWRERTEGSWAILEGMPVSGASTVGAKLLALFAGQATVVVAAALLTAGFQVSRGAVPDPGPYLLVLGLVELPRYAHWGILAVLCQLLAPSRAAGFGLAAGGILLFEAVLPALGVTSPLILFGAVPAHQLSAMNGLAPFTESVVAFRLYWFALSVPLFLAAARLWRRGVHGSVFERWRTGRTGWGPSRVRAGMATACSAVAFGLVVAIGDATGGDSRLRPSEFRAAYEARYSGLGRAPGPEIAGVDVTLDFYPEARRAVLRGSYNLVNRGEAPVARVDVFHFPVLHSRLLRLQTDRPSRRTVHDREIGYHGLALATPLAPGDTLGLEFEVDVNPPRIFAAGGNPDLAPSGSYLDNFVPGRYFPGVGYDPAVELRDDAARREHGLPPAALPRPEDAGAADRSAVPPVIRFTSEVGTSRDQVVVAPGRRVREWLEGGRRRFRFEADSIRGSLAFVTGRYERLVHRHNSTSIEIYHHAGHGANLVPIVEGVTASLEFGRQIAETPHPVLRVVEVPDYGHVAGTARAMPTMIAWNETGGWLDDYRDPGAFPFSLATAAHETAHQWWPGLVSPAMAQGMGVIAEGLPDLARVRVIERQLGEAGISRWMRRQSDQYFRARGTSREQPLKHAIHPFEYREKSQFAFRWLSWAAGAAAVDTSVRDFTQAHLESRPPFALTSDLTNGLASAMPDSLLPGMSDWFDRIVHWDLKVMSARAVSVAGGYEVEAALSVRRFVQGEDGAASEVPSREAVEVGLYDGAGKEIRRVRADLPPGRSMFRILVHRLPSRIRLDPRELLLDPVQGDDEAPVAPPGKAAP